VRPHAGAQSERDVGGPEGITLPKIPKHPPRGEPPTTVVRTPHPRGSVPEVVRPVIEAR